MSLPIRPGRPGDLTFVTHAWLHSYEGGSPFKGCPFEHYKQEMTRAIRRLCEKAELRVAHNPQDDDHIVGFACFTKSELHYLYVKKDFRAELKAEHLLAGVPLDSYTFLGRYMQDALDGYQGAGWDAPAGQSRQWKGPKGWRFTPRITI